MLTARMEEIINMPAEKLYSKAIEFKQINDYNNYYIHMTMAANYDHFEAINCLEENYEANENLKQDHSITFSFYEQTNDFIYSANYLAYMYYNGLHAEKNYQKTIELYTWAVEKGCANSMNNLALMYEQGDGVEKNYQKAIELYKQAIEKRYRHSMNNLALMYERGDGVEKNYQKAIELYKQAIEKGCGYSMNNLTDLYRNHKSLFNKNDIIDFFLFKYPDNLKIIFNYDSDMISCLQENQELKKINKELTDHINLSPGGTEYFEVVNEWKNKLQSDSL